MKNTQINAGDIVRLRSGGPQMTVAVCECDDALCLWFNDLQLQQEYLPITSLEKVSHD